MSSLHNRSTARVPDPETTGLSIVPPTIRARYADAMARIPHVRITIPPSAGLPISRP
ncbi:hypothetical protein ACRAWG_28125 [Methylobacterium sp. P31]